MRICLILEGSYPYVRGGVSTWADSYIKAMPQHEFILWVIGASIENQGNFKYELPENVIEVREVFLDQASAKPPGRRRRREKPLTLEEIEAHQALFHFEFPDLAKLSHVYGSKGRHVHQFLTSEVFLKDIYQMVEKEYPFIPMAEFFHAIRSMFLPILHMFSEEIPEADLYHAVSTGYAGLLGSIATAVKEKPFVLTEHGIYTREREEEIIRATWVSSYFKPLWIRLFNLLAQIAYHEAVSVTSLFVRAGEMQAELGSETKKLKVIRNGIDVERFALVPHKEGDGSIDIGAIVRFHPIKDIKTMLYGFYELKRTVPQARFHLLGGIDDERYYNECKNLIKALQITDVTITGNVDIVRYMEHLDFTILTSISEGQPLSVLESLAAGRPCVTTDVGCCRELLEGFPGDEYGRAGFVIPPMNSELLVQRMEQLCLNPELRFRMGEVGKQRVQHHYRRDEMIRHYETNYEEVLEQWQALALN